MRVVTQRNNTWIASVVAAVATVALVLVLAVVMGGLALLGVTLALIVAFVGLVALPALRSVRRAGARFTAPQPAEVRQMVKAITTDEQLITGELIGGETGSDGYRTILTSRGVLLVGPEGRVVTTMA